MEINDYIHQKKELQENLLQFIEDEGNINENFGSLCKLIDSQNIKKNHEEYELLLRLLNKITKNHYRSPDFFMKIKQIINYLEPSLKQNFTNTELFDIFKRNQPILLILFTKKVLIIDNYIADYILQTKRDMYYFYPEIKSFLDKSVIESIEQQFMEIDPNFFSTFDEKRQIGENDSYICKLIRDDLVEEFISHVNLSNLPLSSSIKSSIFETNPFLLKQETTTLIEYAAFFGSIQIFQHLLINNVQITPIIYSYAIHGKNGEIIYLLDEKGFKPTEETSKNYFIDAVKFHHNEIADYMQTNFFNEKFSKNFEEIFRFYNFQFLDTFDFNFLCKYNYYTLAKLLVEKDSKEINLTSLNLAAQRGSSSLVNFLLSRQKFKEIAFSNCSKLTEINLPSSVGIIGNFAFFGCTSLKKISIPSSVTEIGNSAFENCLSLVTISIPSQLHSIGKYCFCNCRSLVEIKAKSLEKRICDSTFRNCVSLKHVLFSELPIDEIERRAFSGCSSLVQFSIPKTVERIGCFAFKGCSSLTEVEIPSKVTVIEPYTFADCSSIVKVTIPDSLEVIKDYAFNDCSSLTDISLPLSVKMIGDFAFGGCCSLKEPSIRPSVKVNKERAFKKHYYSLDSCPLPLLINEKLFQKEKILGHSDHGWCISDSYIVQDIKTGKSYIKKTILIVDDNDDEEDNPFMHNKIENKLRLYMNSDHPMFANFIGYSFEKNRNEKLTVIIEVVPNISLQYLFKDVQRCIAPRQYNATIRQIILIGVARIMKYLLDCDEFYFIFPRKILLDNEFYPRINIFDNNHINFNMNQHLDLDTSDIPYLSPEFIQFGMYEEELEMKEKILVYSFDIIMYRIVTESTPYREYRSISHYQLLKKVIECGMRPQLNFQIKEEIEELIKKCWSHNPQERPTIKEIFEKLAYKKDYYIEDIDQYEVDNYVDLITSK